MSRSTLASIHPHDSDSEATSTATGATLASPSSPRAPSTTEWLDDFGVCPSAGSSTQPEWGGEVAVESADSSAATQRHRTHGISMFMIAPASELGTVGSSSEPQHFTLFRRCVPSRSAQGSELLRDVASLFLCFITASLAAALPRVIALLSINGLVEQAPMPQALDDFKTMWAPCKDPKNLFPAYSSGGQFYKFLDTAGAAFAEIGSTIAGMSFLHAWIFLDHIPNGTLQRRIFSIVFGLAFAGNVACWTWWIENHLALHQTVGVGIEGNKTTDETRAAWDRRSDHLPGLAALDQTHLALGYSFQYSWSISLLSGTGVLLMRWVLRLKGASKPWSWRHLLRYALRLLLFGMASYIQVWYLDYITDFYSEATHILYPLLCAKCGTALMRFLVIRYLDELGSVHLQLANMWLFVVESTTSVYVRVLGWGRAAGPMGSGLFQGSDLWNTLVVSMCICGLETIVFSLSAWANIQRCYFQCFKNINERTLEGILGAHRRYLRQMDVFYGHLVVGEFSEVSVCVLISVYQLAAPVWNQVGTWSAFADQSGFRIWGIFLSLCIRLCFQIGSGIGFFYVGNRILPFDFKIIYQTILRRRAVFFFFGVMMSHTLNFWPKCQTCELPQVCLVYTECLKHGSVILDGRDACSYKNFVWTADALDTLLTTTNVSMTDMACERDDVTCYDAEDLKGQNCISEGLAIADDCRVGDDCEADACMTAVSSDWGPGVTSADICMDSDEYGIYYIGVGETACYDEWVPFYY
jgi:hypothetical protein